MNEWKKGDPDRRSPSVKNKWFRAICEVIIKVFEWLFRSVFYFKLKSPIREQKENLRSQRYGQ